MRVRFSRRQLAWIGAVAAAGTLAGASFAPLVRARVAAEASKRHCVVAVDAVRPGWFSVQLHGVSVGLEGVEGVQVHADYVRVALTARLRVRRLEVQGVEVKLDGSLEALREQWGRWRSRAGPPEGKGGRRLPFDVSGLALSWSQGAEPEREDVELRGMAVSRDELGTRLALTDGRVRLGPADVQVAEGAIDLDPSGTILRAHARALTVAWSPPFDSEGPGVPSPPAPPPAPAPRSPLARSARAARRARSSPKPPADAGAPLVPLPDLHALRARASALGALLGARIHPNANVAIDALTWKVARPFQSVPLTFGPGPFSLARSPTEVVLDYSTEKSAGGTPLAVRLVLPTSDGDLVATAQGGPVSLALLGVHEQAAGLVDVGRATFAGRARVVLAGDGGALTFDVDGGARNLSLNHPKLALETIHGLDVGLRARGAVTASGDVQLDDFSATVGALRVSGEGALEQKADHVSASARFEIPTAGCQALLDSIPAALLPALQGTQMAGTFGARGHFAFDTRSLDDLELKYDIRDGCRLVEVPPALDRDRFLQPFTHRIYLPDGTTAEDTTGPGTPNWTPLDQISPYMQTAVLTTEDGAFPKHHGYNHAAIRASIIANLKARRFVRGASTITMQLAKNLFLSRDKTLSRKLEELVLTDYLEQTFSKDEIMELYLNVIEFGPAVYGIGPAADYYFGRSPAELNLAECLFLSSLLPSPIRYSAMRDGDQPPEGWMRTLHTFMEIAHKRGLLTDAELAEGESEPVVFWHGGDRPAPRPPVHAHAPVGGAADDVPDPFEALPEAP